MSSFLNFFLISYNLQNTFPGIYFLSRNSYFHKKTFMFTISIPIQWIQWIKLTKAWFWRGGGVYFKENIHSWTFHNFYSTVFYWSLLVLHTSLKSYFFLFDWKISKTSFFFTYCIKDTDDDVTMFKQKVRKKRMCKLENKVWYLINRPKGNEPKVSTYFMSF